MDTETIYVPSRFENIINNFDEYTPLLVKPKDDIKAFLKMTEKMKTQKSGILSILKGSTGIGKTTLIYSLPYYESTIFEKVIRVPEDCKYTEIIPWIKNNIDEENDLVKIISLDGREITTDDYGLINLLTGLNQLLRRRKDILVCWPVNDDNWYDKLVTSGRQVGGKNFIPKQAEIIVNGPKKKKWKDALEKLLIFMDKNFNDLAIDNELIEETIESSDTLGEFLEDIGDIISDRICETREDNDLPELLFVISSGKNLETEANRLRRAGTYFLKAEELMSYSPKSEPGKFWHARGKHSSLENLGYIITLFNVKLLTVKSTAVNYSCKFKGNDILKTLANSSNMKMTKPNGKTSIKSTDLYKYINDEIPEELTSTPKGTLSKDTIKLYSQIQKKSATMHKEINMAICSYFQDIINDPDKFEVVDYEFDAGDGNLQIDAIVNINGEEKYLEFHHISDSKCKASSMARYIMDKIRAYAQHYNLIKR